MIILVENFKWLLLEAFASELFKCISMAIEYSLWSKTLYIVPLLYYYTGARATHYTTYHFMIIQSDL